MKRKLTVATIAILIGLTLAEQASAQWTRVREHASAGINVAGDTILGDHIDVDTGVLSFYVVDVALPGNNELPVQLGRRRTPSLYSWAASSAGLGNWYTDIPRIIGAATCDDFRPSPSYNDDWGGAYIAVPNESRKRFVQIDSVRTFKPNAAYTTADFWTVECVGPNRTFLATSPRGIKYHFDVTWGSGDAYASLIEDPYGNWVRYEYQIISQIHIPTRIHSNDGREITITPDPAAANKRIASATANGRTWTYGYGSLGLETVTLPDGRAWTIGDTSGITEHEFDNSRPPLTIQHPSGVSGTFTFDVIRNGRTYAPPRDWCDDCEYRKYFDSKAVTSKTLTVPNGGTLNWTYQYHEDNGSYRSEPQLPSTKSRTTIDPDGNTTVRHVHRRWDRHEGLVTKIEKFNQGESTPVEIIDYDFGGGGRFGDAADFNDTSNELVHERQRNLSRKTVTRGTDVYITDYDYGNEQAADYGWGAPLQIDESSNVSTGIRTTQITYTTLAANWIVALPVTTIRNGVEFERNGYDSVGQLAWTDRFGVRDRTYDYNTTGALAGTLAWSRDGLNRTTYYRDWYRGTAREIENPDTTKTYRTVDDNGWITSETDARGATVGFLYNNVGWRREINYPGTWADVTITYSSLGNGLIQTIDRGTSRVTTTFDGFSQPVLVHRQALSGGGGSIYLKTEYDFAGRAVFQSWPSTSSNPTDGMDTVYDVLGRTTSETETVAPFSAVTYEFLSGNRTKVTDPLGHVVTSSFSGYGSPEDGAVVKIEQPLGITTELTRDIYGKLTNARQYGTQNGYTVDESQQYYYDNRQRLCRHSVPETNDTLYEYDNADQVIGIAHGQTPGSGCAVLPSSAKIQQLYTLTGQLRQVNYPDTAPDITIEHDANGNVTRRLRGTTDWRYTYNDLDLLTSEELSIDGRTYDTTYYYNSNGYLAQQLTPASRMIDYYPDGLGRPTSVVAGGVTYANNLTYHPNEHIKTLHYGNAHVLSTTQNNRQQLKTLAVQDGFTTAISFDYDYDAAGLMTEIDDLAVSGHNRTLGYDAVGRLTSATGSWGAATYTYDALGNLRRKDIGSREVELDYDSSNRLSSVRDTNAGGDWEPLAYDARGNVTSKNRRILVPIVMDGSITIFVPVSKALTFDYDLSNQPVGMSGTVSASYVYDGNLRRAKQVVNGETVYSVYGLGGDLLYRDNISSGTTTDYLRAGGVSVGRLKNSTITYIHKDHLGSPVAATDTSGSVLWREHYLPFGEKITEASANRNDEGFTGHVADSSTGLAYMQARYYDPVAGRFLSNDPMAFAPDSPISFNRYAYVANDPINRIDPDGKVFRIIVSGGKIIRRTIKARGNVFKAVKDEVAEIVDAGTTLADPSASGLEKFIAIAELASGLDLPDTRAARRAPNPLPIDSRTHGGSLHNSRLDELADAGIARGATDVRKHQSQVDVNGNIVGNNKVDLQMNLDQTHINIEVDRRASSSQRHLDQVSSNDRCAVTICEIIDDD